MSSSAPQICVISDETGPRLDDFLEFAVESGLGWVEVRGIEGHNPLSLDPAQLKDAARRIAAAGLSVAGIATPLLKWPPPGKTARTEGDQFGFDRAGRTDMELFEDAIAVADAFETRNMRIFSYLAYDGFKLDDLNRDFDTLLALAERYDKVLRVENEHVCNIAHVAQLADLLEVFDTPRLEGIPDVANSYCDGDQPTDRDIARVLKHSTHVHIKDFSIGKGRFVRLGDGDVPTLHYLGKMREAAGGTMLTLSIETHVPEAPLDATRHSLAELRRVVDTVWSA
jgi:sugar phosphate isomerase/epimerase